MAIYLDHHATTPVDPRVLEAMLPWFGERFGNASSRTHAWGWAADEAVERARGEVAALLGAEPREIVFTSGATESNNLALKGAAELRADRGDHIVASPIEHPSVTDTLEHLQASGLRVTWLPVDGEGRVRLADVEAALEERTILVSVMAANNEIGTIQPVREIGRLAATHGILFHTDATQGVGKVPFDVHTDGVHLAALTGHKIYGPKGAGALYVRKGVVLPRQQHGGGHEREMRAGTLNVPGIVGLGAACRLGAELRETEEPRLAAMRDRLHQRLVAELDDVVLNGPPIPGEGRLAGNLHVSFRGVASDALMMALPDIALSAGSACASGSLEPSGVMKAIAAGPERARTAIRFGLGRPTTAAEIETVADRVIEAVQKQRQARRR